MDDFGGYSLWDGGSGVSDFGSAWDFGSSAEPSFNLGGSGFDTSWLQPYQQQFSTPMGLDPSAFHDISGGSMPGTTVPVGGGAGDYAQQPQQQLGAPGAASPWIGAGIGALGPLAGLIGALASGGQGPSQGPRPTTDQRRNMEQGNVMAQAGAQGQLPAQQMQMSLLQSLASGQGLPQGYQQLVEQAFQPQMGDLYTQAANQGRARGFHDAPATSPPGGAILGPGLSNLQGQMASAKLGLMHSLPQLFNQPAATQGGFAANYLNAAQGAPMQQTSQQPMGPQIANSVGQAISGAAQGYNAAAQQGQQQDTLNSMLKALRGGITMSGTPRPMANGGIVTQPTNALIGEAGPEAVVPLTRPMTGMPSGPHMMPNGQMMGGQMPQPNSQPRIDPRSLIAILRMLTGASAAGPERQAMLGSR